MAELNEDELRATLDMMERYGGSFVRQLARLYECADAQNSAILRQTFARYFDKYTEMAAAKKGDEDGTNQSTR